MADALYGCQAVAAICRLFDWKYLLTLKEGRQPTTWDETLKLLPDNRDNRLCLHFGQDATKASKTSAGSSRSMLGEHHTNVILSGVITAQAATLFAYLKTLAGIEAGTVTPVAQDAALATVTPKLARRDGRIDWGWRADELANRSRAFDPWPGLFCNFRGTRVKVHGAEVGPAIAGDEPPGTVVAISPAGVAVRCGEGTVAVLTELQREGRRRLPADAFILGERVAPGERLK